MTSLSFSSVSQLIRGYFIYGRHKHCSMGNEYLLPFHCTSAAPLQLKCLVTTFRLVSYFFISWYEVFFQGKDAFVYNSIPPCMCVSIK
jgi:hypothetical protein